MLVKIMGMHKRLPQFTSFLSHTRAPASFDHYHDEVLHAAVYKISDHPPLSGWDRLVIHSEIVAYTHRESLQAQHAGCMQAKSSLTSAYAKLGCSFKSKNFLCTRQLSLVSWCLGLYVIIRAGSFLHDAIDRPSLCGIYDLCGNSGALGLHSF